MKHRWAKRLKTGVSLLLVSALVLTSDMTALAEEVKEEIGDMIDKAEEEKEAADKNENPSETEPIKEEPQGEGESQTSKEEVQEEEAKEEPLTLPDTAEYQDPYEEAYGEPVEVYEYAKVYQVGENEYKMICTSDPNLYKDKNGEEQEVDNTLIEEKPKSSYLRRAFGMKENSSYTNKANSLNITLPSEISLNKGIEITNKEGKTLILYPTEGDYTKPAAKDNAVLYNDVYDGIDVQYTVESFGLKEDIILRKPVEKHVFTYAFPADTVTAKLKDNQIDIYTWDNKEPAFTLSAPLMTDANGICSDAIDLSLEKQGGQYIMTVEADQDWIADESRAYPIKIDPTITVPPESIETVTTSTIHGTYHGAGYGYAGYVTGKMTGVSGARDIGKSRMYYKINYNFASLIPNEAVVNSASLNVYQYGRYRNTNATFGCFRIKSPWNPGSLTWDNSVGLSLEPSGQRSTSAAATGMHKFDIRQTVNDWSQGIARNYGLVVKALNEDNIGSCFFTPLSTASMGQPGFSPANRPHLEITWSYPDPVDPLYPLDNTTVALRSLIEANPSGKLFCHGVFADGVAQPESTVNYALNDVSKDYAGASYASHSYKYPNTKDFEGAFPAETTKYRDKKGNWQTILPFTNPDFNMLYQIDAFAVRNGVIGKKNSSEQFTIYKVKQYDILPKIANYYGITLDQLMFDNRVQDMLLVQNNTLFIRNPKKNATIPYNPEPLTDDIKRQIDSQLMGRGLHCEFGFEPINLNTGNFYMSREDVSIPDYEGDFTIERNYNSKGAGLNSVFGRGWDFAYSEQISTKEDGTLIYSRGDGSKLCFEKQEDGTYLAPDGYDLNLEKVKIKDKVYDFGAGKKTYTVYNYKITDADNTTRMFNQFGSLISIKDSHDRETKLTYDKNYNLQSITSPANEVYGITCAADGKISAIALPNGKQLTYEYDDRNNLITFTDANGDTIRYEYDDLNHMTAWYDGNGTKTITNTYDEEGRVLTQVDANGKSVSLSYGENQTTTTDAGDNSTTYVYDDLCRTKKIIYPNGTSQSMTYDDDNRLKSETDVMGHKTAYEYDANGNITKEERYDGCSKTYQYNDRNQVTKETDYDGTVTEYQYSGSGDLLTVTKAGIQQAAYTYNANHQPITMTDANNHITTMTYQGALISSVTDAEGNTNHYYYNRQGLLTSMTDANGGNTKYMYDAEGRKIGEQTPDGAYTAYQYDAVGDVTAITDANGNTTGYTHDNMGNMLTGTTATGGIYRYTYDALGNMLSETDPQGGKTTYTYDCMNRKISETDAGGDTIRYEYDALGNITKETDASGNVTEYSYDYRNGQKTRTTDALGNSEKQEYSETGLLLRQEEKDHTALQYTYDNLGRMTKKTDVNGLETLYTYDNAGNITESHEGDKVTKYDYDAKNQLIKITYPNGQKENRSYDALGNLTERTNALGEKTTYEYDAKARLIKTTDALGQVTEYKYDGNDNPTEMTDAMGYRTSVSYNTYDQPAVVTDAKGNKTTYEYNQNEQIVKEIDALGGTTSYEYNEQGLPTTITDANGHAYQVSYDKNGNYASIRSADGSTVTYTYDALNRVIKEEDTRGLVTEYEYDAKDRLLREWDNAGKNEQYEYDKLGNCTKETNSISQTTTYEYDDYGRIIATIEPDGNRTTYEYDVMDNLIASTDAEGKRTVYEYDADNRMVSKEDASYRKWQYTYDAIGQLTSEKNPLEEVTGYEYDKAGNLIACIDAKGNVERYQYDERYLVTKQTDKNGNESNISYDELGRAVVLTSAEGGEEHYDYDAAGNLLSYEDALGERTEYEYDSMNRMIKQKKPTGGIYTYAYDSHGVNTEITDPLGYKTTMEADLHDQIVKKTLPNQAVYTYQYDAVGRLTNQTGPKGAKKSYEYNQAGDLIRETDQSHRSVSYEYDKMHRMTAEYNPLKQKTSYAYDENGNLANVVSPTGGTESYTYDKLDRLKETVDPVGKVTTLTYDAVGNLEKLKENGGRVTSYEYDANGNQTAMTNALGKTTKYNYDVMNRLASETDASGNQTTYQYDKNSQVTEITDAKGGKTKIGYDGNGNMTSIVDGADRTISYHYDAADRMIGTVYGGEKEEKITTNYTYDEVGNLTAKTDGNGHTSRYSYDKAGNMLTSENALHQIERYEYDLEGRLAKTTKPSGDVITYNYNELDELLKTDYSKDSEGEVLYAYDQDGRKIGMKDLSGESHYTYDAAGRITSVEMGDGNVILYNYDSYGNLTKLTYPDGTSVNYEYDALDRLTKVTDREGGKTTYDYDDSGNMTKVARPNGTKTTLTYDAANQVEEVQNLDSKKKLISKYTYTYDLSGNILTEEEVQDGNTTNHQYYYNAQGSLSGVDTTGSKTETIRYSYDKAGNKVAISKSVQNAKDKLKTQITSNTYNAGDQLTRSEDSEKGVTEYEYDANGNLVKELEPDETVKTYSYDAESRLLAIKENGSLLMSALYDGEDNRVFVANRKIVKDKHTTEEKEGSFADDSKSDGLHLKKKNKGMFKGVEKDGQKEHRYQMFWYGVGQTVVQALDGFSLGKILNEKWEALVRWYHTKVAGDWADKSGVVKKPGMGETGEKAAKHHEKDIMPETPNEEVYDKILIPYGVTEKNRDTYVITNYVNDVNREHTQVLMEYNAAGKVTSAYEYGNERLSYVTGKEKQYYTYDGNGSVANLTGENGTNVVSYSYDVYGTAKASARTSNPYSYNAEYVDYGTGLQYLRARYYNPNAGAFISEDSYLGELLEPLSQNRYTYAENNPVNYSDPSGHKKTGKSIFGRGKSVIKGKRIQSILDKARDVANSKKKGNQTTFVKKSKNILAGLKGKSVKGAKFKRTTSKKFLSTMKKFCMTNSRVKAGSMSYVSQMGKFNPSNGKYTAVQAAALIPYLEGVFNVENIMKAALAVFGVVIAVWEAIQLGYQLHQYYMDNKEGNKGKDKEESGSEEKTKDDHKVGENGTQISGSKTTGQNGKTERVDVENPNPGKGDGNVHYHEPNNTKWKYDIGKGKLVDPDSGKLAPPRVQKVLEEEWFRKAIKKALKYLGEM